MTAPSELPVIQASTPSEVLTPERLHALDGDALVRWLGGRRWFGAKGRTPRSVRVGAVVPLEWEGGAAAIVRLDVDLGDAGVARYQVPLTVAEAGDTAAALAHVETSRGARLLVDAASDEGFRRAIAESFAAGGRAFEGEGARWVVEPLGEGARVMHDAAKGESRMMSAEQSNTSIVFGDRAILKLFRRLEAGESPDVELTRVLTLDAGFRSTPALLGIVRLEGAGGTAVAGMLQAFAAGSRDAWSWLLEAARPAFARGEASVGRLTSDLRALGEVTRAMHEALASGRGADVAPESATERDVRRWADAARSMAERALALLGARVGTLAGGAAAGAQELLAQRESLVGLAGTLASGVGADAGQKVRHHGDYHLGQVLRTADDRFLVIDFEGEPARPLAERRERHSALRDVAGMLRSFSYATATLAAERADTEGDAARDRARRWEREARAAFLEGYYSRPTAPFLPRERAHADTLIMLFEMEKVFYELSYELDNRPDWAWIPIAGIASLRAGEAR